MTISNDESQPDIYYFIFDRYARDDVLSRIYTYDNRNFISYLENKGFYLANKSFSNYHRTSHSLAATLNLKYLIPHDLNIREDFTSEIPTYNLIENNLVWKTLQQRGYSFHYYGSWWEPTRKNDNADKNFNTITIPELTRTVITGTVLEPYASRLGVISKSAKSIRRLEYQKKQIIKNIDTDNPKFVLAHFLITHPPYFIDSEGNMLKESDRFTLSEQDKYSKSLTFTNKYIKEIIEGITKNSEGNPIIIIQADEGPYPSRYAAKTYTFNWNEATTEEITPKMAIINAIYLPDGDYKELYPEISPINNFIIVFNKAFGSKLELVPDRHFTFQESKPYLYTEVTKRLRQLPSPSPLY
jgi:hypothetical protein